MSTPILKCGRSVSYLHELIADESIEGPARAALAADPVDLVHLADCPHCAAEVAVLRDRWTRVRAVAQASVEVPSAVVTRTLATLGALRGDLDSHHVEITQPGGTLRVRDHVVVVLTRALAHDLVHSYRRARRLPPASARVLAVVGGPDTLTVQLALPYGERLREVAEGVRIGLSAGLATHLDTAGPVVSVHVTEITHLSLPPIG